MGKAGFGTYFFFGSCCFSMFFFVWFLIPETKGMSLERMDDMYAVSSLPPPFHFCLVDSI
jgi:Sugar (and other) transporter